MKLDWFTKVTLGMIAGLLAMIAFRPLVSPTVVEAQPGNVYPFYIEPGTQMLRAPDGSRQVLGKVVVDLRTGRVWGFPTQGDQAYPMDSMNKMPPTSHPFELGKFALGDVDKQ